MTEPVKLRYPGRRWEIIYGSYEGVERFAVNELQRTVQAQLPYVVAVKPADAVAAPETNTILVGTPGNNPQIKELIKRGIIKAPPGPEGFSIACKNSGTGEGKTLVAAGYDADGVRNAVMALNSRVLSLRDPADETKTPREAFDGLREFAIAERPLIADRGIWTWGYVIYDYRRFMDNMARLRMNMITIWNDCPPVNAREVIDYAHSRGIRVVSAFQWGWGLDNIDLANAEHRKLIKSQVLAKYEKDYRHLGIDGLYFQTLTEHSTLEEGGRSVAALACDWANDIAEGLYRLEPGLSIQFGLHATSIRENYKDLAHLDRRIVIAWEDAGNLPYPYYPDPCQKPEPPSEMWPATLEDTIEYSKKLARFRPGTTFALVPKGWTCLRWRTEFEHHGPFVLGERDADFVRGHLRERQPLWDQVNSLWLQHYPLAARFYRELLPCAPRMTVTGLVEDGAFEETIQPSVALFAETLWDPTRPDAEILAFAMSPYYRSGPK